MAGLTFNSAVDLVSDESYINVRMNQYYYTGNQVTSKYTFSFEKWSYNHFSEISQNLLQQMNITNFICPKSTEVYLMSNSFANNFTYFDIKIQRCVGTDSKGNPWKSESDIDAALDSTLVQLAVINNYFDFNDYNKPIKSYLNDELYYCYIFLVESEYRLRR